MRRVLIGTAAVAIAAMTAAYSLPADAQGRGHDKNKGPGSEQAQHPGKGNEKKADRGPKMKDRGPQMQARGNSPGNDKARLQDTRMERAPDRRGPPPMAAAKGKAGAPPARMTDTRGPDRRDGRDRDYYRSDDRYRDNDGPFFARFERGGNKGLIDGCPPGLAKKNNGCLPPGQAKKRDDRYRSNWFGFDGRDDYRYRDGYMVRYGDNGIAGYIPLLAGALSVGQEWPGQFGVQSVPDYYRSYYNLGDSYRYYDNTLYRLDPKTQAITSIAALITGDDITVGQAMPQGYDVYNVPLGYRDRYQDGPEAYYRYSDGYIYKVDPKTRLVAAAIELLS